MKQSWTNVAIWLFLFSGALVLLIDPLKDYKVFISLYSRLLELYLFTITTFFVLKHVAFYKLRGESKRLVLSKNSEHRLSLMGQGVILTALYFVFIRFTSYQSPYQFLPILLLLAYYLALVLMQPRPSILLDDQGFLFDDYFIHSWKWTDIDRIELSHDALRIITGNSDFYLDFELLDSINDSDLNREVIYGVLDGSLAQKSQSQNLIHLLIRQADKHHLEIVKVGNQ